MFKQYQVVRCKKAIYRGQRKLNHNDKVNSPGRQEIRAGNSLTRITHRGITEGKLYTARYGLDHSVENKHEQNKKSAVIFLHW